MNDSKSIRICAVCLYVMRAGLSHWCDMKEMYIDDTQPACDKFIPNEELIKSFEKMLKRAKNEYNFK